ncbi:hypothetical protein [Pseudomonas syringae]|uniref:hypothetical protein n=1 Tax=Pseudomonas syringae TaxID=317 RepID=UPI000A256057|nr:hypothetical protein [Pseudomonas syringae]OSO49004.1 hypothetical protein BV364_00014 [Pseudomonas syringae pv. actinidiae]
MKTINELARYFTSEAINGIEKKFYENNDRDLFALSHDRIIENELVEIESKINKSLVKYLGAVDSNAKLLSHSVIVLKHSKIEAIKANFSELYIELGIKLRVASISNRRKHCDIEETLAVEMTKSGIHTIEKFSYSARIDGLDTIRPRIRNRDGFLKFKDITKRAELLERVITLKNGNNILNTGRYYNSISGFLSKEKTSSKSILVYVSYTAGTGSHCIARYI